MVRFGEIRYVYKLRFIKDILQLTLWYTMLSQWQSSWPFVHVDHHWDQRERASL